MQSRRSLVPLLLAAAIGEGSMLAVRRLAHSQLGPQPPEFAGIDGWLNTAV